MIRYRIKEEKKHEYIKSIHSVIFECEPGDEDEFKYDDECYIKLKGFFSFGWQGDVKKWQTVSFPKRHLEIVITEPRMLEEWL